MPVLKNVLLNKIEIAPIPFFYLIQLFFNTKVLITESLNDFNFTF